MSSAKIQSCGKPDKDQREGDEGEDADGREEKLRCFFLLPFYEKPDGLAEEEVAHQRGGEHKQ